MHAPPADCCYSLATLKYAPQHSGDAGASEGGASMPSSGDMRGAFDQVSTCCGPRLILHILYRVLLYSAACWISLSTPCANGVQPLAPAWKHSSASGLQSALEAAQQAAAAVAEAAEAAARADRLGDAAALFELAARQVLNSC